MRKLGLLCALTLSAIGVLALRRARVGADDGVDAEARSPARGSSWHAGQRRDRRQRGAQT